MTKETTNKNSPRFYQRRPVIITIILFIGATIVWADNVVKGYDNLREHFFGSDSFYDQPLEEQALTLKQDLLSFIKRRNESEPNIEPSSGDDWKEKYAYMEETKAIYVENFRPKVIYVRNRLSERGLTHPDFDRNYEHPVNLLAIQAIADALDALAAQVKKQKYSFDRRFART